LLRKLFHNLAAAAAPSDRHEARFLRETLRTTAKTPWYIAPVAAFPCAIFALHWASPIAVLIWYTATAAYPVLTHCVEKKIFSAGRGRPSTRSILLKATALRLPTNIFWLGYVPLYWIPGDVTNNAFLTVFLMASVVAIIQIYGPCIFLSLTATAFYLPVAAFYTMKTGSAMDAALPVLQVLLVLLMGFLAYNHYRTFRESAFRRYTIEALVRELAEARDAAQEANRAKSAFLASMSHELRTPLNAIIGFSDMMRQELLGPVHPPKYKEYIGDIFSSGRHLLDLINDVLDLSKIEAGKRDLNDDDIALAEVARDVELYVEPQARSAGVDMVRAVDDKMRLTADERAIRQILVNLMSNAIKFSPKGGEIKIFAQTGPGGSLQLGVEDHGIGMDAAGIKKALEPYGQVSQATNNAEGKGTGLGLPIVKALIEAHGATFHIESALGVGTRVWGEFSPARIPPERQAA
jgi:two-component system cell cycle sensor histidine kinase PleC